VFPLADTLCEQGVGVVFVTGQDINEMPPAYEKACCVRKPFRPEDVLTALTRVLQERRTRSGE
jgi:hypothetical protein